MELNHIIENFQLTEAERDNLIEHRDTEEKYIPESFKKVAQAILSGHFEVYSGNEILRNVYPTVVEIYYHEEDTETEKMPENLKDYIVYHRNRPNYKNYKENKVLIPASFKKGSLNTHQSGIDITFEHDGIAGNTVRASALIRGFKIEKDKKEDRRSTYLYDALFSGIGMINGGYSLHWVDDKEDEIFVEEDFYDKFEALPRIDVKQFDANDNWAETAEQGKACDFATKKNNVSDIRLRRFHVKKETR